MASRRSRLDITLAPTIDWLNSPPKEAVEFLAHVADWLRVMYRPKGWYVWVYATHDDKRGLLRFRISKTPMMREVQEVHDAGK